jgi:crotonobetainyl-CoA:carnitine CoA-transferase CaiB-like acyl-CoA transferase
MSATEPSGPLNGLRVFDLTRVLAGPTCVQMLADLGADVIKIEKPGSGDDTRGFAPPFMPGTTESAYFVGVNRNKRSVTLDIARPEGQALALRLIEGCDLLVENFKAGALARYGLGYEQLRERFPRLIYCSITGFGQTGPYAERPGYDGLMQAMGGVMSLTGEPDGLPQKVGIPVADLFAGLYGCIGVLAALRHRDATGQGGLAGAGETAMASGAAAESAAAAAADLRAAAEDVVGRGALARGAVTLGQDAGGGTAAGGLAAGGLESASPGRAGDARAAGGQHIDIGMLDTHVAWLANQGMNYLATGRDPARLGNQHPNIVPYQVFATADGHVVLSIGNDPTFRRFCESFGLAELAGDARFATNAARVEHRDLVTRTLEPVLAAHPTAWWVERLEAQKIGCGPINTLGQVFADPQVLARGMVVTMPHPATADGVRVIANPVRLSATPADYRLPPPLLGEHTDEVLGARLGLDPAALAGLRDRGVI